MPEMTITYQGRNKSGSCDGYEIIADKELYYAEVSVTGLITLFNVHSMALAEAITMLVIEEEQKRGF